MREPIQLRIWLGVIRELRARQLDFMKTVEFGTREAGVGAQLW